ncbi:MAG: response regulator transcription factor [Chloroflexi bacterium]|nr:response regulator transcription factor [Chloroflexota bacterium]
MGTQGRIVIGISGADPLTRAGIEAQLRDYPDIVMTRDAPAAGTVELVVADELDERTLQDVRLARTGGREVVVLVGRVDDAALLAAVEAGARGVVQRGQVTGETLVAAIGAAKRGEGTLPPDLLGRLLSQIGRLQRQVLSPRGLTFGGLTEREVSVLRLLAEGHDTAEVGRRLYFSERTVKNVIHDITARHELRNRAHAVAYAIREGLI